MTLSEYVKKRNGVPFGHPKSLRNNIHRSLGAKNFATFWNYWNPIFSYYLGTKVFRPLRKILPKSLSILLTFVVCGLVHDLVTSIVRGRISLFFTIWFILMSIVVVLSKRINYNLSGQRWILRALLNLLIIGVCVYLTICINRLLHSY